MRPDAPSRGVRAPAENVSEEREREAVARGPHFRLSTSRAADRLVPRPVAIRRSVARWLADRLTGIVTVLRWEWQAFVRRPSAWLLLLAAALTAGWSFSWLVTLLARGGGVALRQAADPIVGFLGPNLFLVSLGTLLVPLLTMNFVAEERRRGTWELLLTAPVSAAEVFVAKFLAGWGMLLAALSPWIYYLLILRLWSGRAQLLWGVVPWFDGRGVDFDLGPVVAGSIGLATIGGTFIAVGLFCSSLCRRPLSAALLTFGVLASVLVVSFLPRVLLTWGFAREQIAWLEFLSCWGQLERFSRGTILPRVMIAHVSIWSVLLWLATTFGRRTDEA